ncbi:putative WD repeat-containing protein slr0143 [Synechocystis sp, PCC 6803 substr. Kazusa] [Rhizoctonia solani]|uniref:Putative WD repeat-containing protein slr0143 [Synechocystis sp, PCC 6803 substr. Kazusa] n=1 Tax=Rhizoctonia solani TaxID=456999 RepID=A0A0K6G501_9AGAM|nr:putative WD repeat-containing protein slr0143 [Synechocystis sp, PCC 6803 substr. Kazusa] [Rhizoctonia solani]
MNYRAPNSTSEANQTTTDHGFLRRMKGFFKNWSIPAPEASIPGANSHTPAPNRVSRRKEFSPLDKVSRSTKAVAVVSQQLVMAPLGGNMEVLPMGRMNPKSKPSAISGWNVHTQTELNKIKEDGAKAWSVLNNTLGKLNELPRIFPPLRSATRALIGCLDIVETVAKNRIDYVDLAMNLNTTSESLLAHLQAAKSTRISDCIANCICGIQEEVDGIQKQLNSGIVRQSIEVQIREEDLIKRYRRIDALFRRLQIDISLSGWSMFDEYVTKERLAGLSPAKLAAYNSQLSEQLDRRGCAENTCTAVNLRIRQWSRDIGASNVCWVTGMPGTGKTTIAYSLSEILEKQKTLGATFFCARRSTECHDATRIFPTIAYQLARYSTSFQNTLCEVLSQHPDIIWQKISTQFEQLIKVPLTAVRDDLPVKDGLPENVVVVIDGLDECTDKKGVTQVLASLFQHAEALPLKFFLTSRPEAATHHKLMSQGQGPCSFIDLRTLGKSTVQEDIKAYLQKELQPMSLNLDQIDRLVQKSGNLFLYAATIVRYIQPRNPLVNRQDRLKEILAMKSKFDATYAEIDALYLAVVRAVMEESGLNNEEQESLKLILWTVLCAQQSIDIEAIRVLNKLATRDQVDRALQSLASVLNVSQDGELVSTIHTSFIEFMFDSKRSMSYYCNMGTHNRWLTERCFELMQEQLHFNICDLESPHLADDHESIGLKDRVGKHVSPSLLYACRYWGCHLELSEHSDNLHRSLEDYLTHRLLFWMEVLNLNGILNEGEDVLLKAVMWLKSEGQPLAVLLSFAEDARNFVTSFAANKVSISTPHLYISALPFCHKSSSVFRNYSKRMGSILEAKGTLMKWRRAAPLASQSYSSETNSSPSSFAFSSDGTFLAIGYNQDRSKRIPQTQDEQDYLIIIRSLRGADIYGPFQGHSGSVTSLAFSSDGKLLASGSNDRTVLVWDIQNGTLTGGSDVGHTAPVNSVAFSPDGSHVASGTNDGTIRVRQIHGPGNIIDLSPPAGKPRPSVQSVSFSPDGAYIVSGGKDSSISVWDLAKRALRTTPEQFQGHKESVNSVAFSPDGELLASGSNDCTIRIWRLSDGMPLHTIGGPKSTVSNDYEHTDPISSVKFSPDGEFIVSGSWDATVRAWTVSTGEPFTGPFEGPCQITAVSFSADGTRILSASQDCTLQMWSTFCGVLSKNKSRGIKYSIDSVEFSPDNGQVATGCSDYFIRLWDLRSGDLIHTLEGHEGSIRSVSFSPGQDQLQLVSGSDDYTIRVWDVRTGAGNRLAIVKPPEGRIDRISYSYRAVVFSPDGRNIASGSNDCTVGVWSSSTGERVIGPLKGSEDPIISVAYTLDGRFIVAASTNPIFQVWDAVSGHHTHSVHCRETLSKDPTPAPRLPRLLLRKMTQHAGNIGSALELTAVAFSHDASYAAFGSSDGTIQAWDIRTPHAPSRLFKSEDISPICSLKFSHGGAVLASACWDRTVKVWDVRKGTLIAGPFQHKDTISSVSLSPDAKSVASGCENSTLLVWDLDNNSSGSSRLSSEQWIVCDDGWVSNQHAQRLFWVPQDIARYHPTRDTKLIIGSHGSVYIDFGKLLKGYDWRQSCSPT